MLYVGIDLHLKQLTVCTRDERGQIIERRQVSTRPAKVRQFLDELARRPEGYVVILEVCGFHDWFARLLREEPACKDMVVVQPKHRSKKKTDRRDANQLSELLWINRQRLAAGERAQGVRRVYQPTDDEQQDRQLTSVRQRLGRQRTKTLNQVHYILRRHNLEWERPTKTFQTKKVKHWLKTLPLGEPEQSEQLPHYLQYEAGRYRRLNRKTPNREVATLFGKITLWRHAYRYVERDVAEPSLFPLEMQLGLVEGATPALADQAARALAETGATQQTVLARLKRDHGVNWGVKKLRAAADKIATMMEPFRREQQAAQVVRWLRQAQGSKGKNRPALAAGRDGITLCTQPYSFFEVATRACKKSCVS